MNSQEAEELSICHCERSDPSSVAGYCGGWKQSRNWRLSMRLPRRSAPRN